MQEDFHYYATYCAAYMAGYTHSECMDICYSAQFVDLCSMTLLHKIKAPAEAATTQLQLELMDTRTDIVGLQNITRIWSSFHFLPRDLNVTVDKRPKAYMNKYRLICGPDGELVKKTAGLAKGKSLQAAGIAMHVIADTWAHAYFAGTPSLAINNTTDDFYEYITGEDGSTERKISFRHSTSTPDDPDKSIYSNSLFQRNENNIMNLGHGRAGHLPDYSFIKYRYMPAWGEYRIVIKDNPSDYWNAFCQMIYAMKYLRGDTGDFRTGTYAYDIAAPYENRIKNILNKRQLKASDDWKAFGEELSGEEIEDFDINRYQNEYISAPDGSKHDTFLGKFTDAAIAHKGMVCHEIFSSGNKLTGFEKIIHSVKDKQNELFKNSLH